MAGFFSISGAAGCRKESYNRAYRTHRLRNLHLIVTGCRKTLRPDRRRYYLSVRLPCRKSDENRVERRKLDFLDRSHKEQPHWEAGKIKMDKDIPQFNKYNRPKLKSDKSKTYYIDK